MTVKGADVGEDIIAYLNVVRNRALTPLYLCFYSDSRFIEILKGTVGYHAVRSFDHKRARAYSVYLYIVVSEALRIAAHIIYDYLIVKAVMVVREIKAVNRGEVAGILGMVSDILEYVKEFEAAGIVDIIAGFFA